MFILVDFNKRYVREYRSFAPRESYITVKDEITGNRYNLWYSNGTKLYKEIPKAYYHVQGITGYQILKVEEIISPYYHHRMGYIEAPPALRYKGVATNKQAKDIKLECPEYFI